MMITAIANKMIGSENSTSLTHMIARSMRPPRRPENNPTGTPIPTAIDMAMMIDRKANPAPKMTRL